MLLAAAVPFNQFGLIPGNGVKWFYRLRLLRRHITFPAGGGRLAREAG